MIDRIYGRRSDQISGNHRRTTGTKLERPNRNSVSEPICSARRNSYSINRTQSEAEDIVQETFLKLYRRRLIVRNPAGWLYRSAFPLGLNALRREKRRDRWHKNAYSAGVLPSTPDVQLQSLEQQALARRVLVRMRERLARVLILRHSGLTFLEIAEIIGINVSSVGTMLNRAEKDFEKNYLKLSKGERPSVSGSLCI